MKLAAKAKSPVFYDFEASCIGGLPIEIGWAIAEAELRKIRSESHLIKPPPHWNLAQVWDPDAEKLHKISRSDLLAAGRPPSEIVRHMNDVLAGRELFSDAPNDDEKWLFKIWQEAGIPAFTVDDQTATVLPEPTFTIKRLNANNFIARLAIKLGLTAAEFEAAKAEAAHISPKRHRAEADARYLAVLWLMISRGTAKRP